MKPGLRVPSLILCHGCRALVQSLRPLFASSEQSMPLNKTARNMQSHLHSCSVEAEPLHRYRLAGYHPVHLGDSFKGDRYKIIHKLGHGAYSTVWLARDQSLHRYVALKILIADPDAQTRELRILDSLRKFQTSSGSRYIERLLDNFRHAGPNGIHSCLVLELLGPSIPAVIAAHFPNGRLPRVIAHRVAVQVVLGLGFLHKNNVGHGGMSILYPDVGAHSPDEQSKYSNRADMLSDLHTGNVVFEIPSLDSMSEEEVMENIGTPETSAVVRSDGKALTSELPEYLVWPTFFPASTPSAFENIKIIDFGESFQPGDRPQTLHTPLAIRAPEMIFADHWDHRVDLWSLGCMLFELVSGQPPFDSLMGNKTLLVSQMIDSVGELPERWQRQWASISKEAFEEEKPSDLQAWLEEIYFDDSKSSDMTYDEIARVGVVLGKLLCFDPQSRTGAEDILNEGWFQRRETTSCIKPMT